MKKLWVPRSGFFFESCLSRGLYTDSSGLKKKLEVSLLGRWVLLLLKLLRWLQQD